MSNNKLKVLTFSFNTNDIKVCSKDSETKCLSSFKSRYKCSYCKKSNCYIPQFFKLLAEYAIDNKFDIVYIATQNDYLTDKHNLHRDYLIRYFSKFGKILKQRLKTGLLTKDIDLKSSHYHSFLQSGLSASIFISHAYLTKTNLSKSNKLRVMKQDFIQCNTIMNKTKGGLYSILKIYDGQQSSPHYLTFVNVNLKKKGSDVNSRNKCVSKILENAILEGENTNTLICCGCFNYDTVSNISDNKDQLSYSLENKSITWLGNNIYETMNKNNYNIPFNPTCYLKKTRSKEYDKCNISTGIKKKYNKNVRSLTNKIINRDGTNREYETFDNTDVSKKVKINTKKINLLKDRKLIQCTASSIKKCKYSQITNREIYDDVKWCERILYSSSDSSKLKCTEYNSYDYGQFMANSKHKAVYAHIEITL